MDCPQNSTNVMEAVLSQPGLKDMVDDKCREMGLGVDVCADLQRTFKRDLEDESYPEGPPSPKRLKLIVNGTRKVKRMREKHIVNCISCREPRDISQFPKLQPSSSCKHGREMCRMCMIAWIRTQVQDGSMPRCAICDGAISYKYVEGITKKKWDKDILFRFSKLLSRTLVNGITGFRWCISPGCDWGQIDRREGRAEDDTVFTCDKCKERSCISCDVRWHEGQTCVEYQKHGRQTDCRGPSAHDLEIAEQESKSKEAIKQLTRECPGSGCGAPIMKDELVDDCDKLKCSRCRLEFCWRCGAPYSNMKKNNRAAHAEHCYWHTVVFTLRDRAPRGTAVAQWEGMPQTTTSDPSYLDD